jgi:hypothetical protein
MLTTDLRLAPWLRMNGAIPVIPLCVIMMWTGTTYKHRYPKRSHPFRFPIKISYSFLWSSVHALYSTLLITLMISRKGYKSWGSSLHSLPHPPATFARLVANIIINTFVSSTLNS